MFIQGKSAVLVDPFGQVPSLEILACLKKTPTITHRVRSNFDIQALSSESCGEIATMVFIELCKGCSNLEQVLSQFGNNTDDNERIVQRFYNTRHTTSSTKNELR